MAQQNASSTPLPIPLRFLHLFFIGFFGNMKHTAYEAILAAGVLIAQLFQFGMSLNAWKGHIYEIRVQWAWLVVVLVIWNSLRAAFSLAAQIKTETNSTDNQREARIFRPGPGEQRFTIPTPPKQPPEFFKLKIWTTASVLSLLALSVLYVVVWPASPKEPVPAPAPIAEPRIEPSYDVHLIGLPLGIAPFSAVYILRIHEGRTIDALTYPNPNPQVSYWPFYVTLFPPESVGELRLSNHGLVSVFNAAYAFMIRFGSQLEGFTDVPIRLPLIDLPVNGRPWSGYIVNQSSLGAMIHLSRDMVAQVQGEATRRRFDLQARDLTFFDRLPLMEPSFHKWSGDQILPPFDTSKGH
jgi:hypothetical protein